jgi:hypothetical protein
MEFGLPEFSAFCLVGETVNDGAKLLADKIAREAAAADLERRQFSLFGDLPVAESTVVPVVDFPPAESVEVETTHWLEVKAWRAADSSAFYVELIDDRDDTWGKYCEILSKRSVALPRRVVG